MDWNVFHANSGACLGLEVGKIGAESGVFASEKKHYNFVMLVGLVNCQLGEATGPGTGQGRAAAFWSAVAERSGDTAMGGSGARPDAG